MFSIATTQLWVRDQNEALEFWTKKVGMEVRQDVSLPEMDGFRWLTVGAPGQEGIAIVLMGFAALPIFDEATRDQIEELMSKGLAGTIFIGTDDCRATAEEFKNRGVEFTSEPEDTPYGVDAGFRDPSGNSVRLTQVRPGL